MSSAKSVDNGAVAHYEDPGYYTKAYRSRRHDVQYYLELAKATGGPVLEYGVGNGRVALAIARAGIDILGVDLSAPMLEDLQRRTTRLPKRCRKHLEWVHGDMRHVRLERQFALVIAPFNTVLHLYERRDFEQFLAGARSHLAKDARFVFDFSVPVPSDLAEDPNVWRGGPRLRHPTTGQLTRYRERFEYDLIRQVLLIDMQFTPVEAGPSWLVPLTHRQFFPREMEAWLHYNGFIDIQFTADFTDLPPSADVDSIVVSARSPGTTRTKLGR